MILEYELNQFNGVNISHDLPINPLIFKECLMNSINEFRLKKLSVVWLFIDMKKANLIASAVECGFIYHHADSSGLLLTYSLDENAFIPGYATHYIGAGGVVINENDQILVIQEKYHKIKHYKLPGGALEPNEHISDAVVREVWEETGIKCEFLSISCFRHWHEYRYGKSDIYFVCRLKPLSSKITIDPKEISKGVWMPIEEYLNDPNIHIFNKRVVEEAINGAGLKLETIKNYKNQDTHELLF